MRTFFTNTPVTILRRRILERCTVRTCGDGDGDVRLVHVLIITAAWDHREWDKNKDTLEAVRAKVAVIGKFADQAIRLV